MSISALGSSSTASTFFQLQQKSRSGKGEGPSSDDIAASIIQKDDADGDGLLSLEETPLDEERFTAIDTDGDGFISAEELSADAQKRQQAMNEMFGQVNMKMQGVDPAEMAASIVEHDDTDGDGVLSLSETPLDEERFNAIDADGDGFITTEELSADMEENMAEGAPVVAQGSEQLASAASGAASESSESDEDYDKYDLNEDGVVSMDELLQAFRNGDTSLGPLLQGMGNGSLSAMMQRQAMEAYQQQML
ncbi:EF-hand domain-containing protein [Salidesulfovibrio onnuriiensis]|uniref:EF-hand domain-containing protein n=1 Tax=Salidesulfovibrio onnuriiensis TaxID=2583823 RepID=UPI00164F85E7|nr:EF-hand domain-containing protein [Salidesulfovibrio onnuriiensis]